MRASRVLKPTVFHHVSRISGFGRILKHPFSILFQSYSSQGTLAQLSDVICCKNKKRRRVRGTGIGKEEIKDSFNDFVAHWFHQDVSIITSGVYANTKLQEIIKETNTAIFLE